MTDLLTESLFDFQLGGLHVITTNISGDGPLFLLSLIAGLVISMSIIPIMVRLAPVLGMIDMPDSRKVHMVPIPRVGGVGIVIGALIPLVVLLPLDQSFIAYLFGALVLLCFGTCDDCYELGHYVKFSGQFIAVLPIVYYGDVYITTLPLMGGEPIPQFLGKLFTVIAIVGMINAINHSDGLDGLAGGESMLSLACIAWLSWQAEGTATIIIALATMGGLLGFLRYNTYPAKIFMGDGGSQFLGYTLGFLAVVLIQSDNVTLSPALPLLMLGLPIADIIAVLAQRIYHKMNWFRATRNHIHHRLLDLGIHHHESVIIIYSIQTLLVLCAIAIPYESDALIIGIYFAIVGALFFSIYMAERSGWKIRKIGKSDLAGGYAKVKLEKWLISVSSGIIFYGISIFLISGALLATEIPLDFTITAATLFLLLLIRMLAGYRVWLMPLRLLIYMSILFVVYLLNTYQPAFLSGADLLTYFFFGLLILAIGLTIRSTDSGEFIVTPMDYLVLVAAVVLILLSGNQTVDSRITAIALKSIILLYGVELLLKRMKSRWNFFTVSSLLSLLFIWVRGVL